MKNLKLFILVAFLSLIMNSYGQEKFTTYDNTYSEKTYEIQLSKDNTGSLTIWIDALSLDNLHEKGGIMVKEKQYQSFVDALGEAKTKYEEWVKTAKENSVTDLDKEMPIKCKVGGYFLYGGDWNFQYLVNLDFDFKIFESKGELKYLLIVRTGELQSSSNQFMKVDGVVLVFSSANEIQTFKDEISMEKINAFFNKPKADDLFK
jgi:hypothetical protein